MRAAALAVLLAGCSTTNIYALNAPDAASEDVADVATEAAVDSGATPGDVGAIDSAEAPADSSLVDSAPTDTATATDTFVAVDSATKDTAVADTYVPSPEEARCIKHYPRLSWSSVDDCYDNGSSGSAAFFCVWRMGSDGVTRCMPARESQVYGYPSLSCSPLSLGFLNEKTVGASDVVQASVPLPGGAWAAVTASSVTIGSVGTWWLHGSCAKQFSTFPYYDSSTGRTLRSTVDFTDKCVVD